jgi:hypothetical protein
MSNSAIRVYFKIGNNLNSLYMTGSLYMKHWYGTSERQAFLAGNRMESMAHNVA